MTRKAHLLRRLGNQGISTAIWRGISLRFRLLNRRSYGRPDEALTTSWAGGSQGSAWKVAILGTAQAYAVAAQKCLLVSLELNRPERALKGAVQDSQR